MNLTRHGHCWKLGDDIQCDGDMISLEYAMAREMRPEVLRPNLFAGIDPSLAGRIADGDIVLAGKGFGGGHPHPQPTFALAAGNLSVLAVSVPRGTYRNLVMSGVPFMTDCQEIYAACRTGDELLVDFATGLVRNLTTVQSFQAEPLDSRLLHTIEIGGWRPMVLARLANDA